MAAGDEAAQARWNRDYSVMEAGRKAFEFDNQDSGRRTFTYIDYDTRVRKSTP